MREGTQKITAGIAARIPWRKSIVTAEQFTKWLAEMKSAGLARSDAKCAEALGISANSVVTMKKNGADLRTALACRALLHRLSPYD
jgi:hypothetical protein